MPPMDPHLVQTNQVRKKWNLLHLKNACRFLFSIKFNYVTRKNIFLLCIENIMKVWKEHFARDLILIWFYSHLLKISTVKICTNWVKLCFLIKNKNFQASSTADPSGTSVSKITVNPAIVKNLIFFLFFFERFSPVEKKPSFQILKLW